MYKQSRCGIEMVIAAAPMWALCMCACEAATQSQTIDELTTTSQGIPVVWEAQNANGDNATDTARIRLIAGGRNDSTAIKLQTLNNDSDVHSSGTRERSDGSGGGAPNFCCPCSTRAA